jgi:membrane protease YdiL (CAAX protease family)
MTCHSSKRTRNIRRGYFAGDSTLASDSEYKQIKSPVDSTPPERGQRSLRRRAPVRLLVLFVVLLLGDVGAQLALGGTAAHVPPRLVNWAVFGVSVALAAALLGIYALLVHRMEFRKATEISPRPGQLLAGAFLGFALFATVIGLIHVVGSAQLLGVSSSFAVILPLATSMLAAVGEELALRGAVFRIVEESRGTLVALVLSAAIFGLLHALNPGATVVSTMAIAIEAGVLLGACYALTRNLWLPMGLHFGWNFTEGGIFGTSVSGGAAGKGIFTVTLSGPTWLTGGSFGPEASVIAIAVCLTVALVLIAFCARAGRWRRVVWRVPAGRNGS